MLAVNQKGSAAMPIAPPRLRPLLLAGAFLCAALPAVAAEDAALEAAVHNPQRNPKFVARDTARHPVAELEFFGLRPDASVVEIWPGGGYWTEILAPYLAAHGTYTVALPVDSADDHSAAKFRAKFEGKPGYTGLQLVTLDKGSYGLRPGSADFVLTFRNLHNWMGGGYALNMFQASYSALKPGGILGVEEHRGLNTVPQDPTADNGYVRQDYTVALAKQAGFELVASSELDANPKDTKIWPKGVWTLPPTFALGDVDHAKYAAVGEADNFILKFRKPK
jgi:predicted methyltransferase